MSNYKSPLRVVAADFRNGELDPLFRMRTDVPLLTAGAKQLRNVFLRTTGAVTRRPGLSYRHALPRRTRLIPFEFDADEKYVMAFSLNALDVYDKGGNLIFAFDGPSCPWDLEDDDFWEMTYVQKGDTMIVAHSNFGPTKIIRKSINTFDTTGMAFSSDTGLNVLNQPYTRYAPAHYTLAISGYAIGGGKTLTASHAIFTPEWVGERVRIHNREILVTAYVDTKHLTVTAMQRIEYELGIAPFHFENGSPTVTVTHALHGLTSGGSIYISGATSAFDIDASSMNGNRIVTVIDEDHYSFTAIKADDGTNDDAEGDGEGGGPSVRIASTSPTTDWTEQVWSERRGWPSAITIHENRLWLGGSKDNPTFLAGSAVGEYFDFNVRDGLEDESVQGTIAALSKIQYLVSSKVLQIFSESSEAILETANGAPITPANFKVVTQTRYGANTLGMPQVFDGSTLFIQKNGKNIRSLSYDYNTDAHVAVPISILASHMFYRPHDFAVTTGTSLQPEQYAFFINSTGGGLANTVPVLHSIVSEKMQGWSVMVLGGTPGTIADSCCCIGEDVFFSIKRDNKYGLERLELYGLLPDSPPVWLDGAEILKPVGAVTTLSVPRFANQTMMVMTATNQFLGPLPADAEGTIALPQPMEGPFVVGYDYGVTIEAHPPEFNMNDGMMTGELRRIVSTNLHLHESVSCAVNGVELLGFAIGQDPSLPRFRFSGKKKVRHLGYGADPTVTLTQTQAGPLTVLGMVMEVSL